MIQKEIDNLLTSLPSDYHYQFSVTTFHKHVPWQMTVYTRDTMSYCFFAGAVSLEELMKEFERERDIYERAKANAHQNTVPSVGVSNPSHG